MFQVNSKPNLNFEVLTCGYLDSFRSALLRNTLKISFFRRIFVNRARRLFTLFCLALVFEFLLASLFPQWLIVLGPILLGIPHLFAGIRYLPAISIPRPEKEVVKSTVHAGVLLCSFLIFAPGLYYVLLKLAPLPQLSFLLSASIFYIVVIGCMIALFTYLWRIRGYPWPKVAFLVSTLLPLCMGLSRAPLLTFGSITTSHNFLAFYYWWNTTKTRSERKTVLAAITLTTLVSLVFGSSFYLQIAKYGASLSMPSGLAFDPSILIEEIFPFIEDPITVWRVLSWFAFCQGLHYFIWLKAIPEQLSHYQVPLSFRRSVSSLKSELGLNLNRLAILLSVGIVILACFIDLGSLKSIYLYFASSHGFLEIAAIPFARSSTQVK